MQLNKFYSKLYSDKLNKIFKQLTLNWGFIVDVTILSSLLMTTVGGGGSLFCADPCGGMFSDNPVDDLILLLHF